MSQMVMIGKMTMIAKMAKTFAVSQFIIEGLWNPLSGSGLTFLIKFSGGILQYLLIKGCSGCCFLK